jgi:RNA polymerase sigma-70 factor (ECF subfamily)
VFCYTVNTNFITGAENAVDNFLNRLFSESNQNVIEAASSGGAGTDTIDIEDVRQSRQGNHKAYRRLVEKYEQEIAGIMWRFSRDKLTHEELVQDVFVEAFLSLMTYKNQAPFIHWLRKIATRVGFRYWKEKERQNKRKSLTIQEWDKLSEESIDKISGEEAAELVHKMLKQLPPRDRLVLTLRFVEGCDVEQTAYRTGWSRSMVKVQTIRAKRKLKKIFPDA